MVRMTLIYLRILCDKFATLDIYLNVIGIYIVDFRCLDVGLSI